MAVINFEERFKTRAEAGKIRSAIRLESLPVGEPVEMFVRVNGNSLQRVGHATVTGNAKISIGIATATLDGKVIHLEPELNLIAQSCGYENYRELTHHIPQRFRKGKFRGFPFHAWVVVWNEVKK